MIAGASPNGFTRLSPLEVMYLRHESADWPAHFGGLAIVDGRALLDDSGRLRLAEIRERLDRRLERVPQLRRRSYRPGRLRGRPLWVDDDRFAIERHVLEAVVPPPGGETELLETAARLCEGRLDRAHPLWELWFLPGLSGGRVGALMKLHHSVADGLAAVAIMASLFDVEAAAPDPDPSRWRPAPIPGAWTLFADNLTTKVRRMGRALAALAHPVELVAGWRVISMVARRTLGEHGAARTSITQPVHAGRQIHVLRLDRTAMKRVGHAHEGTLNDVLLELLTAGLRQLLASRGELNPSIELTAGESVSLRSAADPGTVGNQVGTIVLALPTWEPDAERRLERIVAQTRSAKARPRRPAAIMDMIVSLAGSPIGRYLFLHQRASNVLVTNVPGPPRPLFVLGARLLDVLPIPPLMGNVGLALAAFSYTSHVSLVVTTDAGAFPDVDVLMAAMDRDWQTLSGAAVTEPVVA
jgi:diacylglycerol O-acyltransferase / wax synthase